MSFFAVLFDMLNRAEKGEALTPFERALYRLLVTGGVALISFGVAVEPTLGPALVHLDFSHVDTATVISAAKTSGLITIGMTALKYFMARGDLPLIPQATGVLGAIEKTVAATPSDPAIVAALNGLTTPVTPATPPATPPVDAPPVDAPVLPALTNTHQSATITSSAAQEVAPNGFREIGLAPAPSETPTPADSVSVGSAPTASDASAPATTPATSPAAPLAQEVPATSSATSSGSDVTSAL